MSPVQPTVIWKKKIRPIDHQIIWWMLDADVPGNILQHGWQGEAAKQLGVHRLTMRRRVQVLIEAGILLEGEKKGTVLLNLAIFRKVVDKKNIKMERVGRK